MPRELPGMYWDHEKQRYFPLPRPTLSPSVSLHPTLQQIQPDPTTVKRRLGLLTPYHALSDLRLVLRNVQKDALIRQIQSSQILLTNKVSRSIVLSQGILSAFQLTLRDKTISHSGRVWSFVGDTLGWFYSSIVDEDHERMDGVNRWQRNFYLSSKISSIGVSGTTCVATSFGPECKILYVPLDSSVEGIHVSGMNNRAVHDVWTADLRGSRLILGANKQAVVIEDIAVGALSQRHPAQSDVLSLAQRENVFYAGLRNGGILQFDTRVQTSNNCSIFDSISQRMSSITSLKHLHDYQLLVSFIDGGISTFDLRFPIRTPLMTFTGNFNSYTIKLPLVTDPYEKFLFAAGQDNRIRLWSLTTGGPALHPEGTDSTDGTLFQHRFKDHIAALQVVEEKEGICLWVASGAELCKYSLGHHSGIGI